MNLNDQGTGSCPTPVNTEKSHRYPIVMLLVTAVLVIAMSTKGA